MWLDNPSRIDMLFYSPYADTIVNYAINGKYTPLTIGLYGSWGAGKSSILNLISERILNKDLDKEVVCVSLNAWQFEGYEDAKIAIMESLLKSLEENKSFKKRNSEKIKQLIKRIDFLKLAKNIAIKGLPYALGALTGNPLPVALNLSAELNSDDNIIQNILNFKDEYVKTPKNDSDIQNIRKFREKFESMLKDDSSLENLVVIIDDLDRCTPDRIIDTLEAIKLFLSVKKTTFIIAVDQNVVEYAVKIKYKKLDDFDFSTEYIEKIIQLPIKIPELSPKDIENYLLLLVCQFHIKEEEFQKLIEHIYAEKLLLNEKALEYDNITDFYSQQNIQEYCSFGEDEFNNDIYIIEKIRSVVSTSLKGNPRQAKRFLNTFFVRKNLSSLYFDDELDDAIIAKLLALEIIDTKLFKEIYKWSESSKGSDITELKNLEEYANGSKEELDSELLCWDKERIKRWLMSEPKELFNKDLRKYFYLSREVLSGYRDIPTSLSKEENDLLNSLLNESSGQVENRIDDLINMNIGSQEKIMEAILLKFKTSDDVSIQIIVKLFEKFDRYQDEICEIIITKQTGYINVASVPLFNNLYKKYPNKINKLLSELVANEKIDKKLLNLICKK